MKYYSDLKCWKEGCLQGIWCLLKSKFRLLASCIDHFAEYWETNDYKDYKLLDYREKSYTGSKYSKAQLLFNSIKDLTILKENLNKKITAQIKELHCQLSDAIVKIDKEIFESKTNLELIMKINDKNEWYTDNSNIYFSKPLSFLRPLWKLNEINKWIPSFSEKNDKNYIHIDGLKLIRMLDLDNFTFEEQKIETNIYSARYISFSMPNKNIGVLVYHKPDQAYLYKLNWRTKSKKFILSMNIMSCAGLVYYDGCVYLIRGQNSINWNIYEQYDLKNKTKRNLPVMNKSSLFHNCIGFLGKLLLTGYEADMLYIYDIMIDNYFPVLKLTINRFKFFCQSNSHAYVIEGRWKIHESEDLYNWSTLGITEIPNYDFIKSFGFIKNSIYFLQTNWILYQFDLNNKNIKQIKRFNLFEKI